ncbi:ATP-dependent Clp protease proteolytic subunit 6, chloroplastic isoform C [Glycine soja]|uniref:ATP-dependent Clp protease proteolytic subunit 6, chloroplastic isoform C n=1 Tax=Glycine soja TaxID=3848 RepID=A0A445I0V8_GLYSO|nr:ATP-dependent Clp protease proteolytic subunit 6, chloroplastic isoform C [Glycine soja]
MAPTLALQFLSLFLLFLMNGQGIGARDMKKVEAVELQDQKEVEWFEATDPEYVASYTAHIHKHHHEKLHQPNYITKYGGTVPKDSSNIMDHTEAFKTGYFALDDRHVGNVMTLQLETAIKVFKVSLGAENGDSKIETLGVCHLDTSDWNPNHIIFTRLGIKPGKAPVCHFFPVKHLMWVPQPSQATK